MTRIKVSERLLRLDGATYKIKIDGQKPLYVTINNSDGEAYEVFFRSDNDKIFEWVIALSVVITRALRAGEPLASIGKELSEIHSPATMHHIPGGGGACPSLVARIGKVMQQHVDMYNETRALYESA